MNKNKTRISNGSIKCGKCKVIKPTTDYYPNKSRKDGYSGHCKSCADSYGIRKNTGKGQTKADPKEKHTTRSFCTYKAGAYSRSKVFELTREEFASLIYSPCHYCGEYSPDRNYNGLDRVDNSGGYTITNCVSCCEICNKMKLTYSTEFFISHLRKILSHTVTHT